MDNKPYHHLPDGTFRNPEGSPERNVSFNWSFKVFNEEKRKLKMDIPSDHIVNKKEVLENLKKNKNNDYIAWIGHATFLIKLGETTVITDPVFEKNMGPLIFGPKRYVDPAIDLKEGKCVRLAKGEQESSIIYNSEPIKQARFFEKEGCKRIHIIDLDAAFGNQINNKSTILDIRNSISIEIETAPTASSNGSIRDPTRSLITNSYVVPLDRTSSSE